MEGKGFPDPVAWQLTQPEYRERFLHLIVDGDFEAFTSKLQASLAEDPKRPHYDWSEREDVWINFLGKRGDLSVGYGVPERCFGPEYNFGHLVGDHFEEQVLLIKTAWGGKSIGRDFRSPSAGLPSEAEFERMAQEKNEQTRRHNEKNPDRTRALVTAAELRTPYGHFYREMLREVRECLAELEERFPAYEGQGYELAGFVWFQGWNDQFNDDWSSNYGSHLEHFIRDVRSDLDAPQLPFVIGQVGFDGPRESRPEKDGRPSPRDRIKAGQLAMASVADFEGTVGVVATAPFWDMQADAIYRGEGGWQKDVDRWRQFGNDRPYHYYGSPWFFAQAGTGFGECMLELLAP